MPIITKRALVFDFGGVILKTQDYRPRHAWDERLNLPLGTVERIVHGSESWRQAQRGEISPSHYWADVAKQLKISTNEINQLEHDFFAGDVLDQTVIDYIQARRDEGFIVALLSNDSLTLLEKLEKWGIARLFSPLVISAQIGVMKPDLRAYQAVLAQLNRQPHETVFIDDMPANVAGARAVGMEAVQYVHGMDLASTLAPLITQAFIPPDLMQI